jgi:hypothetical protein
MGGSSSLSISLNTVPVVPSSSIILPQYTTVLGSSLGNLASVLLMAAQHGVHLTLGILRHFQAFSAPRRNPAHKVNPRPPQRR